MFRLGGFSDCMLKVPRSASRTAINLPRVIFLTGKGGTGKSSLAKALAIALARRYGVTLVHIGTRNKTATGQSESPQNENASGIDERILTPRGELETFIEGIVPVKAIARRMLQSRTFGFVTAALPGLEAFLIMDRLRRMALDARPDELIVVDGPATGGALEMLLVAEGVAAIAPFGTLHRLAGEVELFLHEPGLFGVLLTLRPEELATREALDAAKALQGSGIQNLGAVLNGVTEALFSAADMEQLQRLPEHLRLAQERRDQADASAEIARKLKRARLHTIVAPAIYHTRLQQADFEKLADALALGLGMR